MTVLLLTLVHLLGNGGQGSHVHLKRGLCFEVGIDSGKEYWLVQHNLVRGMFGRAKSVVYLKLSVVSCTCREFGNFSSL